jgi:esterase/lipase superfamily enzyme
MQVRIAFLTAVLMCLGANAVAQCPSPLQPLPELETRLNETLGQLAAFDQSKRSSGKYRELQERALQELEQVQCAREEAGPEEAVTRGPSVDTPFALVPVLFLTDRAPLKTARGRHQYYSGDRRASGVEYGRAVVRMPAEDYVTGSPLPAGVSVTTETNAQNGVSVGEPERLSRDQITESIQRYKASLPARTPVRLLIFVHGFNVTFPEATKAIARLSFGLRIHALPIVVSWPSQGALLKYWNDEQNVEPSIERLRPELLWLFQHSDVDEIILVAHSMGSRVASRVLSQLELQKKPTEKLTRVAFAAADLNEAEIRELWTRIRNLPTKGWLFYTSRNDFALLASSIVHAVPPVGDSRQRVFTIDPAETVDASAVAPMLKGYGHSYLIDNPLLRVDLRRWIAQGIAAEKRGLAKGKRPDAVFWEITK